jgi:hypothetical protein
MALKKTSVAPVVESIVAQAHAGASRVPPGPKTFEGFIAHVRASRPGIATALENAVVVSFPDVLEKDFIVAFSPANDALYRGMLTSASALAEFQKFTLEYFGATKRILVEVKETGEVSLAEKRAKEFAQREKTAKDAAANHPLIAEARALFGGELGPIEFATSDEREDRKESRGEGK